ncbi:hypothetical protein Q9Q95_13870 [Sphingomonas sp. DG1-23]|uniref:hypothetical protein n=1 Tax=Sphingomonas sp. DG1-23 TaxID=3068316 RepID=UPI00273D7844|nr:hypothetical protein [Sphingomonas sp. DG1-23]MDP5280016.1 hypothetical protein [Sphingomonas sp. DG1-23]
MSLREAEHLAAEHRKICDAAIAKATGKPDPTIRAELVRIGMRVPDRQEIDRAVRTWVLEQESANSAVTGDAALAKQRAAEFGLIEKNASSSRSIHSLRMKT